ncbi:unnamed protein product [Ilex paraguariensis]|uniref:Uncharacterized protein n=1 Tax=Ilex paraguariensis TaxID=185542 RepID=A0ABC8QYW8_9AQUA
MSKTSPSLARRLLTGPNLLQSSFRFPVSQNRLFFLSINTNLSPFASNTTESQLRSKKKSEELNMSYLNRVWMATGFAVVNGHTDQGLKWKSGLKSLQHNKKRFSSSTAGTGGDTADLRPLSSMLGSGMDGFRVNNNGEQRVKQADESLRQVILEESFEVVKSRRREEVDRVDLR